MKNYAMIPTFMIPTLAAMLLASISFGAFSADLSELAKSRNCLSCHAVERKLVGPSFKAIAERYDGKPGAQEKLTAKILKGGSGVWGPVPMPANGQVSPEEASLLAGWILLNK